MPTNKLTISSDVGGITFAKTVSKTADGQIGNEVTLPAAISVTISAYSGGPDTWTLDFASAHGLSVGDNIDVYYNGSVAYGLEVSVVTDTDTVDVIASTTVPTSTAAMPTASLPKSALATPQTVVNMDFNSDDVAALAAVVNYLGHITFAEQTGTTLIAAMTLAADEPMTWFSGSPITNPLGSDKDVGRVLASALTAAATTLKLSTLYDSSS